MHKLVSIIFLFLVSGVFSQSIENVDFRAEGKTIVVTYDFFHTKADTAINVELVFKDQQGVVVTPKTMTGSIKNVKPGESKRIVWDVLSDGISLSGKYKAEVNIIRFNSVKIGNQIWMTENLNVDRFQNGDIIPEAKTAEEWIAAGNAERPAWCYFKNDLNNVRTKGKLYNWYAVNDSRGLAPIGWTIPTQSDINLLLVELGGEIVAKQAIKSQTGWGQFGNGNNKSKLNGLPNGIREGDQADFRGDYSNSLHWWTSSAFGQYPKQYSHTLYLNEEAGWQPYYLSSSSQMDGLNVRCIQSNVNSLNESLQNFQSTIQIGTQVWSTLNLNEGHFRNGDVIPEAKTTEEWEAAGNAKRPAWCYYDNDPKNGALYGKLYNWYAVNDMRGLAPYGWHVPSDEEWTVYSIDFNGLPGGYCRNGIFNFVGYSGSWWSTSETDVSSAWSRELGSSNSSLNRYNDSKNNGFSVRCVSDDPNTDHPRFIGSNKPSNPFGTGGTVGSTGTRKSPFDGGGSASGEGGSVGPAGTGDGGSRTRLNEPILPKYETEIDIYIHLKLEINEDGKVISAKNITSKTTTRDQEIINSVISEVIKQVKYNKEKNAALQFTFLTCKIRAHN